jgi:hypothetical protein
MHTVQEIVAEAKRLPAPERRRVIDAIEDSLEQEEDQQAARRAAALDHWLALAGTMHSDYTDVSSDKYKHLAEIYADKHEKDR